MERACVTLEAQPVDKQFSFDFVADEVVTQAQLFTIVGKPMCSSCLSGYNSTIFTYGQTGAGKTHTLLGDYTAEGRGLLPRCFESLFASIAKSADTEYLFKCSFLEIYQEQIYDLLDDSKSYKALLLREDFKQGTYVDNLTQVPVTSAEEACSVLSKGSANRRTEARESSRSHTVFTVVVESRQLHATGISLMTSRFNLVDLAGSERQKSTEAAGLRETGTINKSLSVMRNVVNGLVLASNPKPRPSRTLVETSRAGTCEEADTTGGIANDLIGTSLLYRDSKLTFLLKDSLGGNAKTVIIANISPATTSYAETLSTLKFAQRAKLIKNRPVINEACSDQTPLTVQNTRLKTNSFAESDLQDAAVRGCPVCRGLPSELAQVLELPADSSTDTVLQTLKLKCRGMTEQAAAGCMKLLYERASSQPHEISTASVGRGQLEALRRCYVDQIEALKIQLSNEQYDLEHSQDQAKQLPSRSLDFSRKVDKNLIEVHQQQTELQYNLAEQTLLLEEARLDMARLQQAYEDLAAEHATCINSSPRDELEVSIRQVLADAAEVNSMENKLMLAQGREAALESELMETKDQLDIALTARDYCEAQVLTRQGGSSSSKLQEEMRKLREVAETATRQLEAEKLTFQKVFGEYCKVLEELSQLQRRGSNIGDKETQSELARLREDLDLTKAQNSELSAEATKAKAALALVEDDLEAAEERNVLLRNELGAAVRRVSQVDQERAYELAVVQSHTNAQLEQVNSERKLLLQEVESLRSSAIQSRDNSAERKRFKPLHNKENRMPQSIHINICSPNDLHVELRSSHRSSSRKPSVVEYCDEKDTVIAELKQELLKKEIELRLRQTSLFETELVSMRAKLQANEQELMEIKTRADSRRMDEDDSDELMQVRSRVFALETELEHSRDELRRSFASREQLLEEVRRRSDAKDAAKLQVRQKEPAKSRGRCERSTISESASKAKRRPDPYTPRQTEVADFTRTVNQFKAMLGVDSKDIKQSELKELMTTWLSQHSSTESEREELSQLRSKVLTLEQELLLEKQRQELDNQRPLTPFSGYNFQSSADSSFRNLLLEL
jgi:hypothetical protein